MKTTVRQGLVAFVAVFLCLLQAQAAKPGQGRREGCQQAIFEGEVSAGRGFEKVFARGFDFYLEPLPSGWIVRVLAAGEPRGPHDYAELATPPYLSVSPLLISTDWAFRAQDAVAWNPRRFRYAGSRAAFQQLASNYEGVMRNDARANSAVAQLVAAQPEVELTITDAALVPGTADQARMAAAVASHLATTPHSVVQRESPTPLGRIGRLRFRVKVDLPAGVIPTAGVTLAPVVCSLRPTTAGLPASQEKHAKTRK